MKDLPSLALEFAKAVPRSALHPRVLAWAEEKANVAYPWSVAFSGGSDSLALLLLVWAHWPTQRGSLVALHFNHRLRGVASDGDEVFCREVCVDLGIRFRSAQWDEARTDTSEAEARTARHAFFEREMASVQSRALWTGHQKNDIVETQLMRLARGSGTAGLSAPRPVRMAANHRVLLRPLLTLTKSEVNAALIASGLIWREDASNASPTYFRNRIRNSVTPAWEAAAERDALNGAALSRERMEEDDTALEAWLSEYVVPMTDDAIDLRALRGKPRALLRRALRRWAPAAPLERSGFEELLVLLVEKGSGQISLGQGIAVVEGGRVQIKVAREASTPWTEASLREGVVLLMPDGAQLQMRGVSYLPEERARVLSGAVNPCLEAHLCLFDIEFTVRPWRSGDRYRPLGAPGSAKLQDLFVNRKIPLSARNALPVICTNQGEIVWVPGFSPAECSKLTDKTVTGVQLTYLPGTSTVRS